MQIQLQMGHLYKVSTRTAAKFYTEALRLTVLESSDARNSCHASAA
jgi:hypothetical protein